MLVSLDTISTVPIIDKVLPFGLRSAAFLCQRVTSAVRYVYQILRIFIVNYLDDLAGADTEELALKSYQELKNVITFCGLEESVEKICPPSIQMVHWHSVWLGDFDVIGRTQETTWNKNVGSGMASIWKCHTQTTSVVDRKAKFRSALRQTCQNFHF